MSRLGSWISWGTLSLTSVACATSGKNEQEPPPAADTFVVAVDRMDAPATIGPQDTLRIAFEGVIGPNLCYVFDSFAVERRPDRLDVTVMGRREKAEMCAEAISELRGKVFAVPPPLPDGFLVVVHLPGGKTLEHRVKVEG